MVEGIKNVLETLELERCPYWQLKKGAKEPIMYQDESADIKELTVKESLIKLEKVLNMLEGGRYVIEYFDNPASRNTRKKLDFFIEKKNNIISAPINGYDNEEKFNLKFEKALKVEIERLLNVQKIEQIEKELLQIKNEKEKLEQELKKVIDEKNDLWTRVFTKVEHYMGAIIPALFPSVHKSTQPISGNQKIIIDDSELITEKLENSLNKWAENENIGEIIDLIEKIACLAKNNKNIYFVAKEFLNKNK